MEIVYCIIRMCVFTTLISQLLMPLLSMYTSTVYSPYNVVNAILECVHNCFVDYWSRCSGGRPTARITRLVSNTIPHPTVCGMQRQSDLPFLPRRSQFLDGVH